MLQKVPPMSAPRHRPEAFFSSTAIPKLNMDTSPDTVGTRIKCRLGRDISLQGMMLLPAPAWEGDCCTGRAKYPAALPR